MKSFLVTVRANGRNYQATLAARDQSHVFGLVDIAWEFSAVITSIKSV